MSFLNDLVKETRRAIADYSRKASDRYVAETVDKLDRKMDTRGLEEILEPVSDVCRDEADECSSRDYEDLVLKLATITAEAMILTALEDARDDKSLTRRELDDLDASRRKYASMLEEAKDSRRVSRDRDRDRGRDRDRDRDRDRSSSRRDRGRERDRNTKHSSRFERDGDDRRDRRDEESRSEERVVEVESLNDGDVITAANYYLLPPTAKDVPFYYAGIEELVYRSELGKTVPVVVDGVFKVEYDKHRTDIYLNPNRGAIGVAIKVEDLDKRLNKAAAERVNAYIKNEETGEMTEDFVKLNVSKDLLIEGIYRANNTVLGTEAQMREMIAEITDSPDFASHVVAITCEHLINDLENVDRTSEDYLAFTDALAALAIETKLADVKTALTLASRLFDPATYDIIHRLYNEAVCNALSVSLKLGIKTDSILRDWDAIEKLINETYTQQPQIIPIIEMNLCAALPSLFESKSMGLGLAVYRNYIFLPIAKSDLTIASPVRYAALNKSNREEMYTLVNKLLTTNIPQETYKAYTTLVTLDNYAIPLFKNRSLVSDSGYYVFKPIN